MNATPLIDTDICRLSDDGASLIVLDQTLLPNEETFIALHTADEVAAAIRRLQVRGAPLIGIAAAMGLYVALRNSSPATVEELHSSMATAKNIIGNARPTAVNLMWALNRMEQTLQRCASQSVAEVLQALRHEAVSIKEEDIATCSAIGTYGNTLIADGMGVLTHCNAGHLATGRYGTALAPIYAAHHCGKQFKVYADETRPLLQGARLTAYELMRSGVDVTLLCDNMAASLMAHGKVQLVLVGCDRVAANGDVANKIGTLGVAVLAHHYGIPFYVCGPRSTFDPQCATGADIVIEQRSDGEVTTAWYRQPMAPSACKVYNPSFDITPHSLITGYITELGIQHNPIT